MANDTVFIPSLNEAQQDILSTHEDKVSYLVAFTLINPGFTSDVSEGQMVSLSVITARHQNNLNNAADEYQRALQQLINYNCPGGNFTVSVNLINIDNDPTAKAFEIMVLDKNGVNVLLQTHMVEQLKLGVPQ